jgi:L-lactate dehydrogenase
MSTANRNVVVLGSATIVEQLNTAGLGAIDTPRSDARVVVATAAEGDVAAISLSRSSAEAVLIVEGADADRRAHAARTAAGVARVIGTGTLAASRRFARAIAKRLRIDPRDVHANIVGGASPDLFVPLWSTSSIAGVPLHKWAVPGHGRLSVFDRTDIFQSVKSADPSDEASLEAIVDLVRAILNDENRVLPVSTLIDGRYGLSGVTLSLPCIVNARGAEPPLEVPLNDAELAGLQRVAEVLRAASPTPASAGGSA